MLRFRSENEIFLNSEFDVNQTGLPRKAKDLVIRLITHRPSLQYYEHIYKGDKFYMMKHINCLMVM